LQAAHIPTAELEAVLELRAKAMQHLLDFTQYTKSDYIVGPHHIAICDALERLERGDIDRLMIQAPPRHGKSELASRRFPAWYMGRNPAHQIIAASHGDAFARDIAIDVRQVIESPEYGELFDAKLNPATRAADNWRLSQGGMYYGVGIGGSSVGRGAHLLVIDDPIKGRQEADSLTERDRGWRWFQSVAYPRLMENGKIILIFTSWHTDDLGQRILENAADDEWTVIKLPAIDDEGAALWPEQFPIERLERIRASIGAREWNAQYQQEPAPESGTYFERSWFDGRRYTDHPETLTNYICTDFALTDDGDYTEFGVFGVDGDQKIYVLDW